MWDFATSDSERFSVAEPSALAYTSVMRSTSEHRLATQQHRTERKARQDQRKSAELARQWAANSRSLLSLHTTPCTHTVGQWAAGAQPLLTRRSMSVGSGKPDWAVGQSRRQSQPPTNADSSIYPFQMRQTRHRKSSAKQQKLIQVSRDSELAAIAAMFESKYDYSSSLWKNEGDGETSDDY